MAIRSDLKTLYHMVFHKRGGASHAERLENFYSNQAEGYDDFRARLLPGRTEMCKKLPLEPGAVWADMGGGTGANVESVAERVPSLKKAYIVDLTSSLLKVARSRIEKRGWTNVEAVEADATTWRPAEGQVDVVSFSYSLTMIPNWFAAMDHAYDILRPGGTIGVVDFYVARKHPEGDRRKQWWLSRNFWPAWFATSDVFLSTDHVPYLHRRFEPIEFVESRAKVPYLLGFKAPYYIFVGRKPK